mmetsp:Transcript_655/g.1922  ORF Transcript_655/g.1922 Transcript_655/m.1922 type:complete len:241 (+) Transcript_655:485-1207(+)
MTTKTSIITSHIFLKRDLGWATHGVVTREFLSAGSTWQKRWPHVCGNRAASTNIANCVVEVTCLRKMRQWRWAVALRRRWRGRAQHSDRDSLSASGNLGTDRSLREAWLGFSHLDNSPDAFDKRLDVDLHGAWRKCSGSCLPAPTLALAFFSRPMVSYRRAAARSDGSNATPAITASVAKNRTLLGTPSLRAGCDAARFASAGTSSAPLSDFIVTAESAAPRPPDASAAPTLPSTCTTCL